MIGHSSNTLIPPAVLDLVPGEYTVEEPCLYCDDYSDSGSDDEEPRAVSADSSYNIALYFQPTVLDCSFLLLVQLQATTSIG